MSFRIDWWIFLPVCLLVVLGSLVLFSVSPLSFPQHFFYIVLAFVVFLGFCFIDVATIRGFSPLFYVLSLILLAITPLFGTASHGAVRWFSLAGVSIQTSEIVKPFLLIFFANVVSYGVKNIRFVWLSVAALPILFLIFIQPDFGTALVVLAGVFGVLFIGGLPLYLLVGAGTLIGVTFPLLWHFLASYQQERILSFFSFWADPLRSGYNSIQAMIAVGNGGIGGRGLGQGTQAQLAFLPEKHTDFIFASLSEELGFWGAFLVILALSILLFRLIVILEKQKDIFYRSFLGGVFFTIFFQAFVNVGMNMGILPVAGVTLPFVSSGGSSLVSLAAMVGLVSQIQQKLKADKILDILQQDEVRYS